MQRLPLATLSLALLMLGSAPTFGSTPASLVIATIVEGLEPMPADAIAVRAELHNGHEEAVTVSFSADARDDVAWSVTPTSQRILPGETGVIAVSGVAARQGRLPAFLRGTVQDDAGTTLQEAVVPLHLRVTEDVAGSPTAELVAYEDLFGAEGRVEIDGIGSAYAAVAGRPRGERVRLPSSLRRYELDTLPTEDVGGLGVPPPPPGTPIEVTVKGKFRWIDTLGMVRPAFGWRAAIYRKSGNSWVDTGYRTYVGANASFSVKVQTTVGTQLRAVMLMANRYFQVVSNSQIYRLSLPEFTVAKAIHNYGSHYIDLNDVAPGVGELHLNAYDFWLKVQLEGGFNPLRPNPINIVFPATAQCGNCSLDTAVHITADKATSSHTIRHELGHELMYEYWGEMPDESGGYHEWPKCATAGLALSEGFAHFVSWWSTVDRETLSGSWGTGYFGETLPSGICQTPQLNELRVAATFWDLHDVRVDGVDLYTNAKKGRILEMILGGKAKHDTMSSLIANRLNQSGGLEWWRIEPIAEMNFAN